LQREVVLTGVGSVSIRMWSQVIL